jgi:hypothetical protein
VSPFDRRLATGLVGTFALAIACDDACAAEPSVPRDPQDGDMPSSLLPGNDTGVEVWGRVDGVLEYSVALVNGATAGSVAYGDVDSNKDVVGRVVTSPVEARGPDVLRGLSFGVGGGGGAHHGTSTNPELPILATWGGVKYFAYRSDLLSTGDAYRFVPQASWHAGPVSAYAEYARTLDHVAGAAVVSSAWGVVATLVLTGEHATPLHYVVPAHNLGVRRGYLGAFELVAGGGALDVRDDGQLATRVDPGAATRGARTASGGINWYPNLGVRVMIDAEHTWFASMAASPTLPAETLLVGRFQVVL